MTPERWRQIDAILQAAFERGPGDRPAFLDRACAGDADIRRDVEALLASDQAAASFIEAPAVRMAAPLLVEQAAGSLAGQSIGHYQVISLLGRGGMGEVYLARDDRLRRQVALKFLPADLAFDRERMRRFEHEARTASALNHPNVATIYEVGEADGRRFIAMEYVPGQTLAERIRERPLDLADVPDIAIQMAEALEEAHANAIVHRDIKPSNVMVTPQGRVKVLDFGLAKVRSADHDRHSGTLATMPGLVLGTAQYMSPEQARGEEVDHRSDIFSFGAVVYEMATGRAAFKGPSQAETMHAVINLPHAPAREVRKDVPLQLAAVIDRALMKEARSRYPSMTALLGELRRAAVSPSVIGRGVPHPGPLRLTSRLWPARRTTRLLASAVLVVLVAGVVYALRQLTANLDTARQRGQRELTRLTFDAGLQGEPTWSPDGRFIAYSSDKSGNFDIWVQAVGGGDAVQVTKSAAHEWQPDWSPDGNQLVFRSEGEGGGLFVVPVLGGRVRKVSPFGYRPRWSPDGTKILFLRASSAGDELYWYARVFVGSLDGNPPYEVQAELLRDFFRLSSAVWHPDGRRISLLGESRRSGWGLMTVPLAGGTPVQSERFNGLGMLSDVRWDPSGRTIYFKGGAQGVRSLWKVAVDPQTLRWAAGPERLTTGFDDTDAALSPDGRRLAFTVKRKSTRIWLFPFDVPAGKVIGAATPVTPSDIEPGDSKLSPDGRQLLYVANRAGTDKSEMRVKSLAGEHENLLTANEELKMSPSWSRDGTRVAYLGRCSSCTGRPDMSIFVLPADGGKEAVVASGAEELVSDWSADGRSLLVTSARATPRRWGVLATYPLAAAPHADRQGRVITSHPEHSLFGARFSPDDRWVVFQATKAGAQMVLYVVSSTGGDWTRLTEDDVRSDVPQWSPDGKTIYYISNRSTGFFNVWGTRFDAARGQPVGQPFPVTSFNSPGRMLSNLDIALRADRLVLRLTEVTGSVWVLDNVDQ